MSYSVLIRKNSTGEVRRCDYADLGDWDGGAMFWWTEGNFSCDCNRYLEFERAGGHEPTDEEEERDGGCGMERYSVLQAILPDGTEIPVDGDEMSSAKRTA